MPDLYDIFVKRSVQQELELLGGKRRRTIDKFLHYLADNPFDEGDFSEFDKDGRKVCCKIIRDHAITYFPDHPVREIKVIELVRTP